MPIELTDIVLFVVSVTCILTDLARRKIYNLVLLPVVLLAFGYHLYVKGMPGGYFTLQGLSLGLAFLFIPYIMGWVGAGDIKLLATIGALKGPSFAFSTFLAGAIAGGVLAIFYLARNRRLFYTLKRLFLPFLYGHGFFQEHQAANGEDDNSTMIPYGAAIAIGAAAAYFVR